MDIGSRKNSTDAPSQAGVSAETQPVWKERTYVVPTPTRKGFQWKASALRRLGRLQGSGASGQPVTVVVPAVFNLLPGETIALGWMNEIDSLRALRQRMVAASNQTGWDVFTVHTRHNQDPFFASTISAIRETWLSEGYLRSALITDTVRRFGGATEYNRVSLRFVESLVFQTALMEWLSVRAESIPLRFHAIGTAVVSALVWSGALSFDSAVNLAARVGSEWDSELDLLAGTGGSNVSAPVLSRKRFQTVQAILQGQATVALRAPRLTLPALDAPSRPFWFSANTKDEPVLIETAMDARYALEAMDLSSWTARKPAYLPIESADRVRGWLVAPSHPLAAACRWTVRNYLLSTPLASTLFLTHIAALGKKPLTDAAIPEFREQFPLSPRVKVGGS